MNSHQVLTRFAQLTDARDSDSPPTPQCLGWACIEIAGASGGSLTVEYAGVERMTLFASDGTAALLEDRHEVLGEGPGWDAWRTGEPVSARLRSTTRWPMLASVSREAGDVWVAAAVIHAGGDAVGVLSLYWRSHDHASSSPEAADDGFGAGAHDPRADLPLLTLLADLVGAMFAITAPEEWEDKLPWHQRDAINQATGVLVAQLRGTVPDAVALLRSYAFSQEIDLLEAALRVLDRRVDLTRPLTEGRP